MDSRVELQHKLEQIVQPYGMKVYFQPPATVKIDYPCVIYSLKNIKSMKADDINYINSAGYQIMVITKKPDLSAVKDILNDIKYVSFDNVMVIDNLYHYVLTCYKNL